MNGSKTVKIPKLVAAKKWSEELVDCVFLWKNLSLF